MTFDATMNVPLYCMYFLKNSFYQQLKYKVMEQDNGAMLQTSFTFEPNRLQTSNLLIIF